MKNPLTKKVFDKAEKKLKELFFPVELCEVDVRIPNKNILHAQTYKGVVRTDNNHIFSIVSNNYKLITNEEAFNLGKKIFSNLFKDINVDEIKPYRIIHSNSYGNCKIQLVHESVNFMVLHQEEWLPFIQVSNSYNKVFSLKFDLGFVRKLCMNGMIFQKDTVQIKINHSMKEKFDVKISEGLKNFKNISKALSLNLHELEKIYFDKSKMLPLTCKVFQLDFALEPNWIQNSSLNEIEKIKIVEKDRQEFEYFNYLLDTLTNSYFTSLGDNMYAALNVLTDLVSNHSHNVKKFKKFALNSDFYFYRPTQWMNEMKERNLRGNIDLDTYLGKYLIYESYLKYNNLSHFPE